MIAEDTPQEIPDFISELQRQEVAPKIVISYRSDLLGFAHWSTAFTIEPITSMAA